MSDYVLVLVSAALIDHLVLQPSLADRTRLHVVGLCSALLMLIGLPVGWLLQQYLLLPLELRALQLWLAMPLLGLLAWCLPYLLKCAKPDWPTQGVQGVLLGNALLPGLLLQLDSNGISGWQALVWGALGGMGFWLALALFADLRERCSHDDIPQALRGLPIELIGVGVMAMAFSGFNGLLA
jgi:electron transport complex protein RnfA